MVIQLDVQMFLSCQKGVFILVGLGFQCFLVLFSLQYLYIFYFVVVMFCYLFKVLFGVYIYRIKCIYILVYSQGLVGDFVGYFLFFKCFVFKILVFLVVLNLIFVFLVQQGCGVLFGFQWLCLCRELERLWGLVYEDDSIILFVFQYLRIVI